MTTYTLTSTKASRELSGSLMAALEAAIALEAELQPAYGVTVTRNGETIAEVLDGTVDGRDPAAWWEWHDADAQRWSGSAEEAEERCARWVVGESDDGPDAEEGA